MKVFTKGHEVCAKDYQQYDAICLEFAQVMKGLEAKPIFQSGRMGDGAVRLEYIIGADSELETPNGTYTTKRDVSVISNCFSDEKRITISITGRDDEKAVESIHNIIQEYF